MSRIGILGAGTWGVVLARILSRSGNEITVWSALETEVDILALKRVHPHFPKMCIPDKIMFTKQISEVCTSKDLLIFAVPSVFMRSTAAQAREYIPDGQIIVSVSKGIETSTLYTMSEVIASELSSDGKHNNIELVALSGPTHAEEIALDMPATLVSACPHLEIAKWVQDVFANTCMRVYTNADITGVELCGAVKNVIALATGIAKGLGFGDNVKAALITRGMNEITNLGMAMGCMTSTFSGLAGMGDLIVTATSDHSRNNQAGYLIGKGYTPAEAVEKVGMVVEGINALPAVMKLAERYRVEMPITFAVNDIIERRMGPTEAVETLLKRERKAEILKPSADNSTENIFLKNKRGTEMKRVITYGTFDLLHYGHINLLRRAKALGDYLIVALSSDEFNWNEKQKKCYFTYEQRKALLESIRYVDLVIPENNWDQKKSDVHEYHIDTFVMGDDWKGRFDFLKNEGVEVVYLSRTPEISTTQIKNELGHHLSE